MSDRKEILTMPACCFTGHRPKAFPWSKKDKTRQRSLLERIEQAIDKEIEQGTRRFITGNALGVDTWAAEIVLQKKKEDPSIVLEIAVPFTGHNSDIAKVKEIQEQADLVHVVSSSKRMSAAYYDRNKYMVDQSEAIIAVYDPELSPGGGTANTLKYAKKQGLRINQIKWADIAR